MVCEFESCSFCYAFMLQRSGGLMSWNAPLPFIFHQGIR